MTGTALRCVVFSEEPLLTEQALPLAPKSVKNGNWAKGRVRELNLFFTECSYTSYMTWSTPTAAVREGPKHPLLSLPLQIACLVGLYTRKMSSEEEEGEEGAATDKGSCCIPLYSKGKQVRLPVSLRQHSQKSKSVTRHGSMGLCSQQHLGHRQEDCACVALWHILVVLVLGS